jgi:cytochrome P450
MSPRGGGISLDLMQITPLLRGGKGMSCRVLTGLILRSNGGPRRCLGEDFALMEVSYTIVRLLQASSVIALPAGEKVEPVGTERQQLTLVLSGADGGRIRFDRR